MFYNFINRYDVFDFLKKGNKAIRKILRYAVFKHEKRVQQVYSSIEYYPTNWWDIPEVTSRWNQLMTGSKEIDYYSYVSKQYFNSKNNLIGLSLGCGTGYRELRWLQVLKMRAFDAIDLSEHSIAVAKQAAQKNGVDHILKYRVEDINKITLQQNFYDVIVVEQSLHHFTPLLEIMKKIHASLKEDGLLVVNEFVGPTRFQWTDKQINVINNLLSILPEKYRKRYNMDSIKTRIFRPSILRMMLSDPSESVESSNILPFLNEIFTIVEYKEYGGTILQMLFAEIAHNFISDDILAKKWISLFFEIEDILLKEKEITSDFIFAVGSIKIFV